MKQQQFLRVVPRDEAERRFRAHVPSGPLPAERVALDGLLGRVLADDLRAPIDVPGFTRSNVDGFALRARDTFGADEEGPADLALNDETIATGVRPAVEVAEGTATTIATGAIVPRGADAVVMVEDTDAADGRLLVRRPVAPGANLAHAGSDIARGETILRRGDRLSSRDTGLVAALGLTGADVVRRPRVVLFSTGDEVLAPGEPLRDGAIHDSNQRILADAVRECGGEPVECGIVRDDEEALAARLDEALASADLVLFSGGTSKGAGDLSHRVLADRGTILVHGVALKPGKPVVLGACGTTPVVILPGFPTSAVFTFHEFVAPWIRSRAGLPEEGRDRRRARLARAVVSDRGRTEYDLVHLVAGADGGLVAWPLGKGSGSLTTWARADGFHAVPAGVERREAGETVDVTLTGPLRTADLVVIGSHCVGLDLLLGELRARHGLVAKLVAVGSTAGLEAARRGECDVAGIHLLDEETGAYNEPFVARTDGAVVLARGYRRRQGVASRDGSRAGRMVNRNRGSGTRVLIDRLLDGARPDGYELEVRSHQAVAAAVAAGRADWGVCIEPCARAQGLSFEFLADERFDFAIPAARRDREPVRRFLALLEDPEVRERLAAEGFATGDGRLS